MPKHEFVQVDGQLGLVDTMARDDGVVSPTGTLGPARTLDTQSRSASGTRARNPGRLLGGELLLEIAQIPWKRRARHSPALHIVPC
jgi:hypothetical protein